MSGFDIILIVILAAFAWRGFSAGLIRSVGSFVGIFAGAFLASHFYLPLFNLTKNVFGGYDNIGKLVCFIVVLALATRLVYWLFVLLDKTYDFISILPFLKSINHLGGAVLGLIVGGFLIGLLIYVAAKFFQADSQIGQWLLASQVAPTLLVLAKLLLPALSMSLKSLQSMMKF